MVVSRLAGGDNGLYIIKEQSGPGPDACKQLELASPYRERWMWKVPRTKDSRAYTAHVQLSQMPLLAGVMPSHCYLKDGFQTYYAPSFSII